jgi:hypothetical protein
MARETVIKNIVHSEDRIIQYYLTTDASKTGNGNVLF